MQRVVFFLLPLTLALAACGSSDSDVTADLREQLRANHEFDNGYDGLGTVEFADDTITVDTKAWADPSYGAYLYCDWVFNALEQLNGTTADTQVRVIMDGDEVLNKRGASESCVEASA